MCSVNMAYLCETLNHLLGKLQRMQLFGHGVKPIKIVQASNSAEYTLVDVVEEDGVVKIIIEG